jgi:hypothetical protein
MSYVVQFRRSHPVLCIGRSTQFWLQINLVGRVTVLKLLANFYLVTDFGQGTKS